MKNGKIILLLCTAFLLLTGCSVNQKKSQAVVSHSFYWGGTVCSGVYTGGIENGKPHGKGSFEGYVMRDGEEQDEVSYIGMWKEGKISGNGTFTNITEDVSYKGKFANNARNGEFIVRTGDQDTYEKVCFRKDIPYGVSLFCSTEDKQIVGYDRYYKGMRVSEILEDARAFDYADLIYHMDEYSYEEIYLDCQVLERMLQEIVISDEDDKEEEMERELIAELKVKDTEGNIYIVAYNVEYPKRAENYMPEIAEGDNIRVYGFIKKTAKKEAATSLLSQYPLIEAVTAEKSDSKIDMKNLISEYQNFCDYPYEYQGSEVKISGIVKQMGVDEEGQLVLVVESDSYSNDGEVSYVCAYSKDMNEKKYKEIPKVGEKVSIHGELDIVYLDREAEDFTLYPKVKIADSLLIKE